METHEFGKLYCQVIVWYCVIVHLEHAAQRRGIDLEHLLGCIHKFAKLYCDVAGHDTTTAPTQPFMNPSPWTLGA